MSRRKRGIRQKMRDWSYSYNRFVIKFQPGIRFVSRALDVLAFWRR